MAEEVLYEIDKHALTNRVRDFSKLFECKQRAKYKQTQGCVSVPYTCICIYVYKS